MIRSFLSLAFLRPPKAILVPGMYFLGFSRYSNCDLSVFVPSRPICISYQCILLPLNALGLVGVCVRETLDLASLSPEEAVEVGADLVALASAQVVALRASCLGCVSRSFDVCFVEIFTLKRLAPFLSSPRVNRSVSGHERPNVKNHVLLLGASSNSKVLPIPATLKYQIETCCAPSVNGAGGDADLLPRN